MAEASATIIDFCAYRARKRPLKSPRDVVQERVPDIVPIGFYFFLPMLAWMPLGLLLTPTVAEDFV